jgi:hypothetical protein
MTANRWKVAVIAVLNADPHLVVLDPDPYWECGSEFRSNKKHGKWPKTWLSVFQNGFCTFVGVFLTYFLLERKVSCKNSTFCDLKIPSGPGSALVWLPGSGFGSKLR